MLPGEKADSHLEQGNCKMSLECSSQKAKKSLEINRVVSKDIRPGLMGLLLTTPGAI